MLVPLRIPTAWAVRKNFFDDRPFAACTKREINFFYDDEILVLEQIRWGVQGDFWATAPDGYVLDLGWVPAGDPNGSFRLVVFKEIWSNNIYKFLSNEHDVVARKIEQCLRVIDEGHEGEELKRRLAEPPQ
jgi:hypothetical protein